MMAALLGDGGYGVMTVGTIAEAVELATDIAFDLFILDVRLPDGTGVELCEKLRELRPAVPVLYYSAYGQESEQEAAVARCGDAFLRKPVAITDIENSIARLLGRPLPNES